MNDVHNEKNGGTEYVVPRYGVCGSTAADYCRDGWVYSLPPNPSSFVTAVLAFRQPSSTLAGYPPGGGNVIRSERLLVGSAGDVGDGRRRGLRRRNEEKSIINARSLLYVCVCVPGTKTRHIPMSAILECGRLTPRKRILPLTLIRLGGINPTNFTYTLHALAHTHIHTRIILLLLLLW